MALLKKPSSEARPLRLLAASALCLYLLVHVFLILCLVHPHNAHLQAQADDHLGSVCTWIHKNVSSHVPSSRVILPLVAAAPLVFLPLVRRNPQISSIRLTGRSPPQFASA
jgi:hypothetical protein